jgi:hypothetical protein
MTDEFPFWATLFSGIFTGLAVNLLGHFLWNLHIRPTIEIEDVFAVESSIGADVAQIGDHANPIQIDVSRIRIWNCGRSSATNCKAFLVVGNQIERVAWMLPSEQEGGTVTLNVQDREFINLCARTRDRTLAFRSTERGLPDTILSARTSRIDGIIEGTLRITSSNAEMTERRIRIDPTTNNPAMAELA